MKDNKETLRPELMSEFIGQETIKKKLSACIEAAKKQNEPMAHTLLYGAHGYGKTTLAGIIANETGVDFRMTSRSAIEKQDDLVKLMTGLNDGDILFVDEIHHISSMIDEMLRSAPLPRFTLIGAATREEGVSAPLKELFANHFRFEPYTQEELSRIIIRSAKILEIELDADACMELAAHSQGTPRIANRLLRRASDFAGKISDGVVTLSTVKIMLSKMEKEKSNDEN